jgi:fatty-acyl-CoA synthase
VLALWRGDCCLDQIPPRPHATELELQAWCKERIAHFKTPRYFKFVEEFPMTVTGKIQKFRMREISIEELVER